jgi:hypothetical protein
VEQIASIFEIKEEAKQETSMKQAASTVFHAVSCLAYFSAQKICSSKTSDDFQQTPWVYVAEHRRTFHKM